jgi:uncharacterized protein YndB with AHSA1/START domain
MAKTKVKFVAEPGKQEYVLTWTLEAPREKVFRAYTDPQEIPNWWGPRDCETEVKEQDPRPGGRFRYVVRDAEGEESGFHGVFHEVVSGERLVRTFEFEAYPGHVLLETVTFEEIEGRTKLTSHAVFQSQEFRDYLAAKMEPGAQDAMDQLAELLAAAKQRWRPAGRAATTGKM